MSEKRAERDGGCKFEPEMVSYAEFTAELGLNRVCWLHSIGRILYQCHLRSWIVLPRNPNHFVIPFGRDVPGINIIPMGTLGLRFRRAAQIRSLEPRGQG